MTVRVLVVALLTSLHGCVPYAPEPEPPPVTDAGCAEACATQRELGCEGGGHTEDGVPCEAVCEDAEAFLPGSYHTGCVAAASDCAEVEACFGGP